MSHCPIQLYCTECLASTEPECLCIIELPDRPQASFDLTDFDTCEALGTVFMPMNERRKPRFYVKSEVTEFNLETVSGRKAAFEYLSYELPLAVFSHMMGYMMHEWVYIPSSPSMVLRNTLCSHPINGEPMLIRAYFAFLGVRSDLNRTLNGVQFFPDFEGQRFPLFIHPVSTFLRMQRPRSFCKRCGDYQNYYVRAAGKQPSCVLTGKCDHRAGIFSPRSECIMQYMGGICYLCTKVASVMAPFGEMIII